MNVALTDTQLREIEQAFQDGLSSSELVAVFRERKVAFTEATLRKYVQQGLVPRSTRVGVKGRHQGSRGIYPVRSVRRINLIKRLMAERYTIEEIAQRFLPFKDAIETLDEAVDQLISLFERRLASFAPGDVRARMSHELESVRTQSHSLRDGVLRLEKFITSATGDARPRGGGAADPTELL